MYVGESMLRTLVLEIIRIVAPRCIGFELHQLPGPYRWQNWRIGKLDIGVEDYSAARDKADEMAGARLAKR